MAGIRQAVILAGGEGTRLRPLTLTTPKPLIPIHEKPFAVYLLELLKKNGIEQVIFLTGYLAEQFPQTLGDGSQFGLKISYSESAIEDDTGTRLRKAAHLFDETFVLMYGDNYWPLDLKALEEQFLCMQTPALVTVYERSDPEKKNNMGVHDNLVTVYDKKRETPGLQGVDIGFFILKKEVIGLLPEGNVNFEKEILPQLIEQKQLAAFLTKQPYWGLTDVSRLPSVERALNPTRKVLFLDRDGTLNARVSQGEYVRTWEEFSFLPGTLGALGELIRRGYELYIITNQPGIARGMVKEEDLAEIHTRMQAALTQRAIPLTGIYYCPHGRDEGCDCRKPNPGMLFRAAREHDIDLTRAYFVGDDERDKEAGNRASVTSILVSSVVGVAEALDKLP